MGCKFISVNKIDQTELIKKITEKDHPENLFYAYFTLTYRLNSSNYLNNLDKKTSEVFNFQFKTPKNKIITEKINFLDADSLKKETLLEEKKLELQNNSDLYGFKIIGNKVYLKIGSMQTSREYMEKQSLLMKNDTIGFRKNLDYLYEFVFKKKAEGSNKKVINEFPVLAKICSDVLLEMKAKSLSNLIIDLQSNQGGDNSTVFPLFYMLYGDNRFEQHDDSIFSTRLSQNFLNKYYDGFIDKYNKESETNLKVGDFDYFDQSTSKTIIEQREEYINELKSLNLSSYEYVKNLNGKPLYTPKKILVLTNPTTFSSGFIAAVDLQNLGAKLVGVPSAQSTNATMEIINYTLPYSKFTGYTSSKYLNYFPNLPKEQNVLKLGYHMNWNDFKKYNFSIDAEIQFAKEILNEK
jgi:Peptidase family S41